MAYLAKAAFDNPVIHVFFGDAEYDEEPHEIKQWAIASTGDGVGKTIYDNIVAVEGFSDKSVVILEGAPDYSIEKWDISGTPSFAGLEVHGHGNGNNQFNAPVDVTIDGNDCVYVLDLLSTGDPTVKMFDNEFNPIGTVGDATSITGTPIAMDWDSMSNAVHVLHSDGVAVFTM